MTEKPHRSGLLGRLQLAGAVLVAAVLAGTLLWEILRAPGVPFLPLDGTPWIVAQTPLQTNGMHIDRAHPPTSFFELRFRVDELPEKATLRVRALREARLLLNGRPLPADGGTPERWKEPANIDVTSGLVPGDNVLFARVTNPDGNPALQLRIDGLGAPLETDATWRSAWEGDPVAYAALADDVMRHPESGALPSPPAALVALAAPLSMLAAGGGLLFLLLRSRPQAQARAPAAALGLVILFWILLYVRLVPMPAEIGFDSEAHLAYIRWLLARRGLPTAADGSAMYHPPLFHALAALVLAGVGQHGIAARMGLLAIPMLSGLGMVLVARSMARTLRPSEAGVETGAVLAAGLLPMSLTLAACVSNEAPHAFLASFAVLATVRALVRERTMLRDDLVIGFLLAAAVLTKYSSLVLVPILLGAVAAKRLVAEPAPVSRALSGGALGLGIVALLSGWFYLRHYMVSGHPLVWNMNATPGETWWQLPGFHTTAYFTGFGESLVRPWFSSFHSLWDSLYSTLWGDGLLSGAVGPGSAPPRWRYEWMAASFLLALPATAMLALGWASAVHLALRDPDGGRRLAWSLVALLPVVFLGSLLSLSLHYPFWSAGKAFYALLLTPVLALLGAMGFEVVAGAFAMRGLLVLRVLAFGWAGAFLGAIAWAYAG